MAIDRGILDEQLQQLGEPSRWWDLRELRDLPSVLHPDERIIAMSRGKVARVRVLRRAWLIVVTDKRLLCLRSGGRKSWRQIEVDARQIARVSLRVGPFRGRVLVVADSHRYRLLVPRSDAYKVNAALLSVSSPAGAVTGFAPTRVIRRVVDHVLALPAVALDPHPQQAPQRVLPSPAEQEARERHTHEMEQQMQQLRDQVEFLEQLLRQRGATQIASAQHEE
jgi:hypothetical protein